MRRRILLSFFMVIVFLIFAIIYISIDYKKKFKNSSSEDIIYGGAWQSRFFDDYCYSSSYKCDLVKDKIEIDVKEIEGSAIFEIYKVHDGTEVRLITGDRDGTLTLEKNRDKMDLVYSEIIADKKVYKTEFEYYQGPGEYVVFVAPEKNSKIKAEHRESKWVVRKFLYYKNIRDKHGVIGKKVLELLGEDISTYEDALKAY